MSRRTRNSQPHHEWAAAVAVISFLGALTCLATALRRSRRDLPEPFLKSALTDRRDIVALANELEKANADLAYAIEVATAARVAAEASEHEFRLLDMASQVLASSLDYEA